MSGPTRILDFVFALVERLATWQPGPKPKPPPEPAPVLPPEARGHILENVSRGGERVYACIRCGETATRRHLSGFDCRGST